MPGLNPAQGMLAFRPDNIDKTLMYKTQSESRSTNESNSLGRGLNSAQGMLAFRPYNIDKTLMYKTQSESRSTNESNS